VRNHARFIVTVLAAAAVAVVMAGCAPAGPATARPQPGASIPVTAGTAAGSPAGRAAGPGASGTARFLDYEDNDGPISTAVLTGAIGDYGKAVSVNADGTVNPEHTSELEFTLSRGSFRLDIAALDRQFVAAFSRFPTDVATCSGVIAVTRRAPVVTGSGTGAYRGITGTFDVTITIAEVDAKLHCNGSSPFLGQQVVMSGTGVVSFASR
jgi:hypothetical protein